MMYAIRSSYEMGTYVLPDNAIIGCHLDETASGPLGYQSVAVGQALSAADKGAVKAVGVHGHAVPCLCGSILPDDL